MKEKVQIKGKKIKIVFWAAAVFWMAFIFYMSSQNGEESAQMSSPIVSFVSEFFFPDFEDMPAAEREEITNTVSFVIRKTAHFSEYAVLGFLFYLIVQMYIAKIIPAFLISWAAAALYAASDELHQMFIGGRSPQIRDVCIDSAGAFTGIFISLLLVLALVKRISKRDCKYDEPVIK